MASLLDDEALRGSKLARAREVVARFDETRMARQYLDLYEELAARHRRR
jgi:glycosyltransferase involved in cell wall biosynthesis